MNLFHLAATFQQDLKFGIRQLRLHPGFAFTAVISLALGIGANSAIFTLVDQVILRLLPVREPERLVQLKLEGGRAGSQDGDGLHTFSYPLYRAFRDRNSVFTGLTGQVIDTASLVGDDRSEMIRAGLVTGNFFEVFGVRPQAGRLLAAEDSKDKNTGAVVVLQYGFWQNRFGGNKGVVGSKIRVNGYPFQVVGITAEGFEGTDVGRPTDIWLPVTMRPIINPPWDELENERYAWFYLFGRLKPGISIQQAQAAIKVLYRERQEEEIKADFFSKFPELRERYMKGSPTLIPAQSGQSSIRGGFERPLLVLQGLVALVLLIACTNVANLLLARAASRQKEVAIRGALGASRAQLVRQLLVEGLILALAGGIGGVLISTWVAKGLVRFLPYDPANLSLSAVPDRRIMVFTIGVTLLTALLFGLMPALRGSRVSPGVTLKEEAGAVAGGHGHVRLRKFLVALQVGLSCLLLIGAGLFARTIRNLQRVDLGFESENVIMFGLRPATVYDEARKARVFRDVLEAINTVPGVKIAGANSTRLLMGGRWDSSITIPGVEARNGNQPWSFFNAVTPGYFEALGIPIKHGRDVTWADWGGSRKLCLVNEALVREYLGGQSPVGRMLAQGTRANPDHEIIGVFGDSKYHDVRGDIPRQTFVALDSRLKFIRALNVYARIEGDPRPIMTQLQTRIRGVDSNLVVSDMRTMNDQLNMRLSNERLLSFLSAGVALLASLLAAVGLHGVLAFVVARRTREIGIRMALGFSPSRVIRMVMGEMVWVIIAGVAAGAAGAYLMGRLVETQLYGVEAADVRVFAGGVLAMIAAALAATLLPAWRASRIDPARALRTD